MKNSNVHYLLEANMNVDYSSGSRHCNFLHWAYVDTTVLVS